MAFKGYDGWPMKCLIPGCGSNATDYFGVRLRKPPQGNAVWAPNCEVYLCDVHAVQGVKVTIFIEQTDDRTVETRVAGIAPGSLPSPQRAVVTRMGITKSA